MARGRYLVTHLDDDVHDRIVKMVKGHLALGPTAHASGVSKHRLKKWLDEGEKDLEEGRDTPFSQLKMDFDFARSVKAQHYITLLEECPKNYQAICWLLERAFREDFGAESGIIKEILDEYAKLKERFDKEK